MSSSDWLDALESALDTGSGVAVADADLGEAQIALAFAAGREISVPDAELQGAVRRALFVLAAGGDPARGLDLSGRAVETLADDLDRPLRRKNLSAGLEGLRAAAGGRSAVTAVLETLRGDGDLAWRAFSAALMLDALAQDDLADG